MRSALISFVVFLALKPIVRMRSWWHALGVATGAAALQLLIPWLAPTEPIETVLSVGVFIAACVVVWFWRLRHRRPITTS